MSGHLTSNERADRLDANVSLFTLDKYASDTRPADIEFREVHELCKEIERLTRENASLSEPPSEVVRLHRDNDRLRERLHKRYDDCPCVGDPDFPTQERCEECMADERTLAEVRRSATKKAAGNFVELTCPFCTEKEFDALGLKHHLLNGWCDVFEQTSPIVAELTDAVIAEMRWTCAHGNVYERWIATAACGCDRPVVEKDDCSCAPGQEDTCQVVHCKRHHKLAHETDERLEPIYMAGPGTPIVGHRKR